MSEFDTVQLVALIGWLVLVVGAFASFRLSWKQGISLVLIWAAIFGSVFLLFTLVRGG